MEQQRFRHSYPSQTLLPEILDVSTLEHPHLKEVFEAWRKVCGPRCFPDGPTVMLRPIKHLLKFVVLCDVTEEGRDFRFRLLGEAVFPGLEESQIGKLVSIHPDPGIGVRFMALMRAVIAKGTPVRGLSKRITGDARLNYRTETLWLPFGEMERVTQIMSLATFTQFDF